MSRHFPRSARLTDLARFVLSLLWALAASLTAPLAAQGTMADEFARLQDFSTSPPTLDPYLTHITWSVEPNGSYEHMTGPPFPQPGPFYLPPGLHSISCECKSGSDVTSSNPRCVTKWSETFVTMVFTDGSRYSYEDTRQSTVCSDGSSDVFHKRYQIAELGPPGARDALVLVQSWADDTIETWKIELRGRAGAAANYRNRGGVPVVSGGPFAIVMGAGSTLDLRQNPAAAGPLFVTDGPMLLRCDFVLMDPGVTLADLCSVPPIVLPPTTVADVTAPAFSFVATRSPAPFQVQLRVGNAGTTGQLVQVSWNGPFTAPGQMVVNLPSTEYQRIPVTCQFPASTPIGTHAQLQFQVASLTTPGLVTNGVVHLVREHPGVLVFGTGTPGCLGPHTVGIDGPAAAGGPAFALTATQNLPAGIGAWLLGESIAGQYGTLAVPGIADLYVDPFAPFFLLEPFLADGAGVGTLPLQLPNNPALRSLRLVCQPLGLWVGSCTPGVLTFSSGPALEFEVQ